ncbi:MULTISPECIES: DeoR/GlpR family DNA-binding transcription regulator [Bacillus]|uniref:DeoR family transcriptional regulator, myo-inositol catabolism operon repressor n=1 Tax=Bacillus amyloliquefaciens (strain Y2) TaxID=1155777 RepID=I2CC28_BACAY|nr:MULTISPECIES: DeoR/GlpR family DNA-binding transcription regulator [Bacillus]AFJ64202.1 DeoR family transcriptional regulator, myo-inositol catabolism operon repressor [Bacillus velezensis YAU B9601-Y2]AJE76980.1 DeoR faimly transcriptional regulator [Bacillus sp. BH072]AUG38022.1 DeoR/GlpR transcriptional regulator [Bacillus velezensis]KFI15819.1 DeoR faimly transcriptional regulator [Bacillus velezensis]KOC80298.1 DeoR faimly transcriptional regulator [Bacillus velezensis]
MKLMRIQEMEEYILKHGATSLDELCEVFNVSKNTVRRDINKLAEKGVIKKVYGGVTSAEKSVLVPFENRTIQHQDEKIKIARYASRFIEDHDLVFIDSGTTTKSMLETLDPDKNVTVLTNSLDIINAASSMKNIDLIIIGNNYKRKTRSFVGIDDPSTLNKYNINKAFMSATGTTITHGLTNSDLLEYEVKKRISEKANEVYLLADHSKFGKSTLLTYAPFDRLHSIVTSQHLDEEYTKYCQEHQIDIHLA